MPITAASSNLAPLLPPVKSNEAITVDAPTDSMIQHNASRKERHKIIVCYSSYRGKRYAVSLARRVLSPQALLKHLDIIRSGLSTRIGLTPRQADVTIELLRLWAYYGQVYPKAAQVVGEPEISPALSSWRAEHGLSAHVRPSVAGRATFWRTIRVLEDLGLVEVVNRYVIREHARISNLYRLDQLVLVLARYIAERRRHLFPSWLTPILAMPGRRFWAFLARAPGDRAGPKPLAFPDLLLN